MDMQNFFYMLSTGRYMNDARIVVAMNCGTIGEAVRCASDYGHFDASMCASESVKTLTSKGYITPTATKHAKQVKSLAGTKTRMMK